MRTLLFFFSIILISATSAHAQKVSLNNPPSKKLKLSSMSAGFGLNYDRFQSMSLNDLLTLANNPNKLYRDLSDLDEETSTTTAGVSLYFNMNFAPTSGTKRFLIHKVK